MKENPFEALFGPLFGQQKPDNRIDEAFRKKMRALGWSDDRINKVIRKKKEKTEKQP